MKRKTNENGITAIYVRRSVADRDNNSLSIESQKEDCIRYVGENCVYRIYCDNGFSGKDTKHRPAFQSMMQDARNGQIKQIIVKKYDRFSRNLRDYLNVTDELDKYGVTVYSLSEPFNTATKEGRMMRNNLLNFAEFERETIAARVADAYSTRSRETGFYLGGTMSFGYSPKRMNVGGKTGSVLVPSEQAEALKTIFAMYAEHSTSLRDILNYFSQTDSNALIRTDKYGGKNGSHNGKLNVASLSTILANPLYVKADKDVYAYFQTKGYEIIDDAEAYDGKHGIFFHSNPDGSIYVKVGYHLGLVSSDIWLRVQDKKSHNVRFSTNGKAYNSWLIGLVKCKECGYAVMIDVQRKKSGKVYRYLIDNGWMTNKSCISRSYNTIKVDDLENRVFEAICERIKQLEIAKKEKESPDSESESIKAEILRINDEIRSLMDRMSQADDVVFNYIQQKIKELHAKKTAFESKLQTKARKNKAININPLSEPLKNWNELTVQDKHNIAAEMIDVIYISHNSQEIEIIFGI